MRGEESRGEERSGEERRGGERKVYIEVPLEHKKIIIPSKKPMRRSATHEESNGRDKVLRKSATLMHERHPERKKLRRRSNKTSMLRSATHP